MSKVIGIDTLKLFGMNYLYTLLSTILLLIAEYLELYINIDVTFFIKGLFILKIPLIILFIPLMITLLLKNYDARVQRIISFMITPALIYIPIELILGTL